MARTFIMPMVQTFEEPKEKPATTRTRKAAPKKEPKKREPKKREPKRAALPKPSEIIEEVNKAGEAVIPTDKDAGSAVISDAVTRLRQQALATYRTVATAEEMRYLVLNDLFYLLVVIMGRADMNSDFCFMRCAEVQASPNEHIDLWAREHYKSTIITVGKTIQDILRDPELTVVIFSHTRPNAKAFLRQIMRELELNKTLFNLFPDILYNDPRKEARQWSEETGILLKRRTNPKENTVEAWGVVDGQPTGKHFALMVYDDIVTKESVSTPEMIRKTTEAWELSLNLSARGGHIRYIGTRYHANDTYDTLLKREAGKPRIYPATVDGTPTGAPVLLPANLLMEKARLMGSYTFACQMLQNPLSDKANGFDLAWLRYWSGKPAKGERDEMGRPKTDHTQTMNRYLLVDPANAKKKHSDYTAMWVIGLAQDGNYYVIDGVRDRLNLSQRWEKLYALHKKHRPQAVGYERYGVQTDIDYFREKMDFHNYHFDIVELGGSTAKSDRIRKLAPVFQSGRFFLPYRIPYVTVEGEQTELVTTFIDEEYNTFPIGAHDDSLDCMSRILDTDLAVSFPELFGDDEEDEEVFGEDHVHTFDPLARWRDNKRADKTLSTLRFQ